MERQAERWERLNIFRQTRFSSCLTNPKSTSSSSGEIRTAGKSILEKTSFRASWKVTDWPASRTIPGTNLPAAIRFTSLPEKRLVGKVLPRLQFRPHLPGKTGTFRMERHQPNGAHWRMGLPDDWIRQASGANLETPSPSKSIPSTQGRVLGCPENRHLKICRPLSLAEFV